MNITDVIGGILSTFDDDPVLIGSHGIRIQQSSGEDNKIYWYIDGLATADSGLYPRSVISSGGIRSLEWVNIVAGDGIAINNSDTTMTISATGGTSGTEYRAGVGIAIDSENDTISQSITSVNPTGSITDTQISIEDNTNSNVVVTKTDGSTSTVTNLAEYQYSQISTNANKLIVNLANPMNNPVYIKLVSTNQIAVQGSNFIGSGTIPTGTTSLITVQFGVAKIDIVNNGQ